jgi:hypothetical protein
MAPRDVRAGHNYAGEITRAIRGTRMLLVVLTERTASSSGVMNELELAKTFDKPVAVLAVAGTVPASDELVYRLARAQRIEVGAPPFGPAAIERALALLGVAPTRPPTGREAEAPQPPMPEAPPAGWMGAGAAAPPGRDVLDVMISYRRQDSDAQAQLLFELLREEPGVEPHMDIEIGLGDDFVQAIEQTLERCQVVLAVVGPKWLTLRDRPRGGVRRIELPNDFVRMELETAHRQGLRIVPVTVGGARMPAPDELPEALRWFATRNALELRGERAFRADVRELARLLVGHDRPGDRRPG